MNLLDGLIGGIRRLFMDGVEKPFKTGLDFRGFEVIADDDKVRIVNSHASVGSGAHHARAIAVDPAAPSFDAINVQDALESGNLAITAVDDRVTNVDSRLTAHITATNGAQVATEVAVQDINTPIPFTQGYEYHGPANVGAVLRHLVTLGSRQKHFTREFGSANEVLFSTATPALISWQGTPVELQMDGISGDRYLVFANLVIGPGVSDGTITLQISGDSLGYYHRVPVRPGALTLLTATGVDGSGHYLEDPASITASLFIDPNGSTVQVMGGLTITALRITQ